MINSTCITARRCHTPLHDKPIEFLQKLITPHTNRESVCGKNTHQTKNGQITLKELHYSTHNRENGCGENTKTQTTEIGLVGTTCLVESVGSLRKPKKEAFRVGILFVEKQSSVEKNCLRRAGGGVLSCVRAVVRGTTLLLLSCWVYCRGWVKATVGVIFFREYFFFSVP